MRAGRVEQLLDEADRPVVRLLNEYVFNEGDARRERAGRAAMTRAVGAVAASKAAVIAAARVSVAPVGDDGRSFHGRGSCVKSMATGLVYRDRRSLAAMGL